MESIRETLEECLAFISLLFRTKIHYNFDLATTNLFAKSRGRTFLVLTKLSG
jgi:hypothetical protein